MCVKDRIINVQCNGLDAVRNPEFHKQVYLHYKQRKLSPGKVEELVQYHTIQWKQWVGTSQAL